MISEHSIKDKDFSVEFKHLIAMVEFTSLALINASMTNEKETLMHLNNTFLAGGNILRDVAEDLQVINDTLYPEG